MIRTTTSTRHILSRKMNLINHKIMDNIPDRQHAVVEQDTGVIASTSIPYTKQKYLKTAFCNRDPIETQTPRRISQSRIWCAVWISWTPKVKWNALRLTLYILVRVCAHCTSHSTAERELHTVSLSLIHIWRCRRIERCRSRWSPYH